MFAVSALKEIDFSSGFDKFLHLENKFSSGGIVKV